MTIRAADATFEVNTFSWTNGVFELTGTWRDSAELGRVRLLVDVGGRRKSLGSQGGRVAEDGPDWGVRFICMTPPDDGGYAAMQVAGREIRLPTPVVNAATPPPAPPPPAPQMDPAPAPAAVLDPAAAPDPVAAAEPVAAPATNGASVVHDAEALLKQIRSERQALEQARDKLARERQAAEQLEARLAQARKALAERPALPPRRALDLNPREREPLDSEMVYWVAGAIALAFLLMLIIVF